MRDRIFLLLAPPLALLSPVWATMQLLSHQMISPGALIFLGGIALVGLFLGAVAAFASGKPRLWTAVPAAVLAITVILLLDMTAGGVGQFGETAIEKVLYVAGVGVPVFAFLWLIRRHVATISFAGAVAFFASTILVPAAHAQDTGAPFVYIVMDEMIGLEGIDRSIPGGEEAYEAMRRLADRHDLRVHGRAFSRHFFSSRSIPAALNFDEHDDELVSRHSPTKSDRLDLIGNLLAGERKVVIYQSAHIDFCAVSGEIDCRTFPSFDATDWVHEHGSDLRVHVMATANVMHRAFTSSSFINRYVGLLRAMGGGVDVPPIFDIHGFASWFKSFEQDVLAEGGDAYFAHFLMPHAPTIMSPECVPESQKATFGGYYLTEHGGLTGDAFFEARSEAYGWYFDQLRCAITTLDGFLSRLEVAPGYENATIVIHGDHGSRISGGKLAENLSDRDMIDNFSAFYAIKGPRIEPGIDHRKVSVQRLTAEYFSGKSATELGPVNQTVVLETTDPNRVILREMPDF